MQSSQTQSKITRSLWMAAAYFGPIAGLPIVAPVIVGLVNKDRSEIVLAARSALMIQAAAIGAILVLAIAALSIVTPASSDAVSGVFVILFGLVGVAALGASVVLWIKHSFGSARR